MHVVSYTQMLTIFHICGLSAIDDEFTRPGLEYFLFCFFDKVNPFEDWSLSDL